MQRYPQDDETLTLDGCGCGYDHALCHGRVRRGATMPRKMIKEEQR